MKLSFLLLTFIIGINEPKIVFYESNNFGKIHKSIPKIKKNIKLV